MRNSVINISGRRGQNCRLFVVCYDSLLLVMSALRVALNRLSWRVLPLRSAATVRSSQRLVAPAGKEGEMREECAAGMLGRGYV